jgi:hypothetical protein
MSLPRVDDRPRRSLLLTWQADIAQFVASLEFTQAFKLTAMTTLLEHPPLQLYLATPQQYCLLLSAIAGQRQQGARSW